MNKKRDITDQELLEIAKNKRKDIENYRRERGEPEPIGDSLVGMARHRRRKKKDYGKNKRELPDKEYTIIPNEFIEAGYKQNFGANQHKVLWYLVRKTWSWHKRSEFIRVTQCAKELEIPKSRVSEALSSLRKRGIVTVNRNKTYAIQTDTSLWRNPYRKKREEA